MKTKIIDFLSEQDIDRLNMSATQKIRPQITFNYRIREDFSQSVVGASGQKVMILSSENYKNIATIFWETVVQTLDINYFLIRKSNTNLKFFLEADFTLNNQGYTFRIYFDVRRGEKKGFHITGHSFNQNISTSHSLKQLDLRIAKLIESVYNIV